MFTNRNDFSEINNAFDRLMSAGDNEFDLSASEVSTISEDNAALSEATPSQNGGFGTLIAQVSMASGSLPVEGAVVTVMNTDGSIIERQSTDISGRTPGIRLSAPSSEYSQTPGDVRPYSVYNMRVDKPGFYSEEFLNIAVFDRIESVQPVALEPLGEDATEGDRLIVVNENVK